MSSAVPGQQVKGKERLRIKPGANAHPHRGLNEKEEPAREKG